MAYVNLSDPELRDIKKDFIRQHEEYNPVPSLRVVVNPHGLARVRQVVADDLGFHFASIAAQKSVKIWSAKTLAAIGEIKLAHFCELTSIAWGGNFLAIGAIDGTIKVWRVAIRENSLDCSFIVTWRAHAHSGPVTQLKFSPNGSVLISAGEDLKLIVWKCDNGNFDSKPLFVKENAHLGPITGMAFNFQNNDELATVGQDRAMKKFLVSKGEYETVHSNRKKTLARYHDGAITGVAASPVSTSNGLVTIAWDRTIRLWNWKSLKCTHVIQASHLTCPTSIAHLGDQLVSVSADGSMKIWSVASMLCQHVVSPAHDHRIASVVALDSGTVVTAGGSNIKVWSVVCNHTYVDVFSSSLGNSAASESATTLTDEKSLAHTQSTYSVLGGMGVDTSQLELFQHRPKSVQGASLQGNFLFIATKEKLLQFMIPVASSPSWTYQNEYDLALLSNFLVGQGRIAKDKKITVLCLAVSPDCKLAAFGTQSAGILVLDLTTSHVHVFEDVNNDAKRDMGSEAKSVAAATRTGEASSSPVRGVSFDPTGTYLVSCSDDLVIRKWFLDPTKHEIHRQRELEHTMKIRDIDVSRDGKYIISCDDDRKVVIWDAVSLEKYLVIPNAHQRAVTAIAFSPLNNSFATASSDKYVFIWSFGASAKTPHVIGVIESASHPFHTGRVLFDRTGYRLLTTNPFGGVRMWPLNQTPVACELSSVLPPPTPPKHHELKHSSKSTPALRNNNNNNNNNNNSNNRSRVPFSEADSQPQLEDYQDHQQQHAAEESMVSAVATTAATATDGHIEEVTTTNGSSNEPSKDAHTQSMWGRARAQTVANRYSSGMSEAPQLLPTMLGLSRRGSYAHGSAETENVPQPLYVPRGKFDGLELHHGELIEPKAQSTTTIFKRSFPNNSHIKTASVREVVPTLFAVQMPHLEPSIVPGTPFYPSHLPTHICFGPLAFNPVFNEMWKWCGEETFLDSLELSSDSAEVKKNRKRLFLLLMFFPWLVTSHPLRGDTLLNAAVLSLDKKLLSAVSDVLVKCSSYYLLPKNSDKTDCFQIAMKKANSDMLKTIMDSITSHRASNGMGCDQPLGTHITTAHIVKLLEVKPGIVADFLHSLGREQVKDFVGEDVTTAFRSDSTTIMAGSESPNPHAFWTSFMRKPEHAKFSTQALTTTDDKDKKKPKRVVHFSRKIASSIISVKGSIRTLFTDKTSNREVSVSAFKVGVAEIAAAPKRDEDKSEDSPEPFLKSLLDAEHEELFDVPMVSDLLMFKWKQYGRDYYVNQAINYLLFIFFFSAFILVASAVNTHASEMNIVEYVFAHIGVFLLGLIVELFTVWYVRREYRQFKEEGALDWVSDVWNFSDMILLLLVGVSPLFPAINLFASSDRLNTFSESVWAIASLLMWLKLLYFGRAFRSFGSLVRMLFEIVTGLRDFVMVLFVAIIGFSFAFFILLRGTSPKFASPVDTLLSVFAMMLGDFDLDDFENEHSILATTLFVLYMLTVFLIMLNVVISIIGDKFEQVQEGAKLAWMQELARILLEIDQFIEITPHNFPQWLQGLEPVAAHGDSEDQGWGGKIAAIVSQVDSHIAAHMVRLNKKVDHVSKRVDLVVTATS